ncbi:hypothetical protein [Jiella sonneratiae]|uniref:DUF3426 domain-containing protein n=1 Tax=Jiella sonneratiae TaxID=2816856 RepID=A0ABS3IYH9_9HYPH|nr:hypothetical protein [Jiella sonneratiae]MBO0902463.1 hypothetical protein [Jiella sonneratiae]
MREHVESRHSQTEFHAASQRSSPAARTIDGAAKVTARRRTEAPFGDAREPSAFGRRAGGDASDRKSVTDQAAPASPDVRDAEAVEFSSERLLPASPVALGAGPAKRRMPGRIGLFVCAFAFGALLLPVFLVSFPEAPIAATATNAGGYPVELSTVSARVADHGAGRVLTVEGRITNPSRGDAAVPPLKIDFADRDTGLRSRTLQTSVARLSAGQSIEFVSMVALAEDSTGEVRVGFVDAAPEGRR